MTIPAAMMIESAIEHQAKEDPVRTRRKISEFTAAGFSLEVNFLDGYLLGIATAEVILLLRGQEL